MDGIDFLKNFVGILIVILFIIMGSSDKVRGIPTQISTIHDRKRTVCP